MHWEASVKPDSLDKPMLYPLQCAQGALNHFRALESTPMAEIGLSDISAALRTSDRGARNTFPDAWVSEQLARADVCKHARVPSEIIQLG